MSVPGFTSSVLPPYRRGVELGRHFAAEVATGVARYRRLFETTASGPFDVDLWSGRAWAAIARLAPVHAQEIAGIAAGAGLRPEQVASVAGRDGCLSSASGVSTRLRRDHLLAALTAAPPETAADVVTAMTHHLEHGGVCRHPVPETDPVLWHRTLATVELDVRTRRLEVTAGGPCGARLHPAERPQPDVA